MIELLQVYAKGTLRAATPHSIRNCILLRALMTPAGSSSAKTPFAFRRNSIIALLFWLGRIDI